MRRLVWFLLCVALRITEWISLSESSGSCFEDAKMCENGEILKRDPDLNCEFPQCSDATESNGTQTYQRPNLIHSNP